MVTNNLRDLTVLKPIVSAKAGQSYVQTSQGPSKFERIQTSGDKELMVQMIWDTYREELWLRRRAVARVYYKVYDGKVAFEGQDVSSVLSRINQLERETGRSIESVIYDIRRYVQDRIPFVTGKGEPVSFERIQTAHQAVQAGKKVWQVKKELYI